MTGILDGLGADPAVVEPSAPEAQPLQEKPLLVLRAIAAGQLPGVLVPEDAPRIESDLTPDDLLGAGVGLYRPRSPGLAMVLFNPQKVPEPTLAKLDQEGRLGDALPSITDFLGGAAKGPVAEPEKPAEETEMPQAVPVLPRPGMSAEASQQAATMRMKALAGEEPSKRMKPGAGILLNGLLERPI